MARTRASVAAKVVTGKSSKSRCSAPPAIGSSSSSGSSSEKSSRSYSGGNTVCPRETPKWQKPITNFFIQNQTRPDDAEDSTKASSSKSKPKPKRNIIESDDEDEHTDTLTDKPINKELDETIELEPLTGENSHKIDEYYSTGKLDEIEINKENFDTNNIKNKRKLEESEEKDNVGSSKTKRTVIQSDEEEHTNKDQATKEIAEDKTNLDINKENLDTNVTRNKRSLECEDERDGKKIKLN